jgi:hypothetical protein
MVFFGGGCAGTLSYLINFTFLTEAQGNVSVVYKKYYLTLIRDLIQFPSIGSPSKLIPVLQQLLLSKVTFPSVNLKTKCPRPPRFLA